LRCLEPVPIRSSMFLDFESPFGVLAENSLRKRFNGRG
jgi:hypothetical protein